MGYRVAVVGATGSVGREMMNILEELRFPVDELYAVASRKSIGVEVSTYQSVSGACKEGMDELWEQTKGVFVLGPSAPKKFPKQIAFNVIPFIGTFLEDGYTDEEAKMWNETKKMIDPAIELTVTC